MDMVDLVLIMTVNPGIWRTIVYSTLDKISEARRMIAATGRAIDLEVDGGITPGRLPVRRSKPVPMFSVAGTAVFKHVALRSTPSIAALRGVSLYDGPRSQIIGNSG